MELKDFLRNNKQRREKIAKENGYSSAEDFISELKNKKETFTFAKVGDNFTLSEVYKIKEIDTYNIIATSINGEYDIEINKQTFINKFHTDSFFERELSVTSSETVNIIDQNKNQCMTVIYYKKAKELSKKELENRKNELTKRISEAKLSDINEIVEDIIQNPITKVLEPELRELKGYHNGEKDLFGRYYFQDLNTSDANKLRLVDTRTIQCIIVNGFKYCLN